MFLSRTRSVIGYKARTDINEQTLESLITSDQYFLTFILLQP